MREPIPLLVASTNAKKLRELKDLLADLPFTLSSLNDLPGYEEVEETGKTFEENACLKAQGYARQSGLLTLAEDSGLCCDALEGAPGIYSARFSGEEKSDHANNLKVLRLLEKLPDNCREAHFISVAAIAEPGRIIGVAQGKVHGYVSREIRGERGFGYDPIFYYPPFQKTFGEVDVALKHQVSHRRKSLEKVKEILVHYLQGKPGR